MNSKRKPIVVLLSGMMLASLAIVAADSAWSEAPGKSIGKKTTAKKPATKKPATRKSRPAETGVLKSAPAATPAAKVVTSPVNKVEVAPPTNLQASGTLASAPRAIAAPSQAAAASPAPQPRVPVPTNPYLTVPQANPWNVGIVKAPIPPNPYANPYLAYRQAPLPAAPTPWSAPVFQAAPYGAPTWVNPFLAFQFPALPFPAPVAPAPQVLQAPPIMPPAVINPYLAYRLPPIQPNPPTPWTSPASQPAPFPVPAWINPFQGAQQAMIPVVPTLPALTPPNWSGNPYLAYQRPPAPVPAIASPAPSPAKPMAIAPAPAPQAAPATPSQSADQGVTPWTLPSPPLTRKPADNVASSLVPSLDGLKSSLLASIPPMDQAILPVVKTVYPTGEKPLKVLTFKCPTELVGVTPLPTKALHELVNLAMDGINSTDLLPFNMQQVCQ